MFEQISLDIMLLLMLYAVGTTVSAIACIYLLFRRGNAFAPRINTPRRLRRWTAVFFGVMALGHLWYLPSLACTTSDDIMLCMIIGGLLDCLLTVPVALVVMLCMLQDRRRPLWPVGVAVAPLVIMMVISAILRSYVLLPWLQVYFLLMAVAFTVYLVRAVQMYGRWLRDNYADLENKEVWKSLLMIAAIMLMFGYYVMGYGGITYEYIIQVCGILLVCQLLWRVETLSSLSPIPSSTGEGCDYDTDEDTTYLDIDQLLNEHCEATQLYLQHDLTVSQLAQELGTNRFYLSQYFAGQGTTYNAYINMLRIDYFVSLYRESVASGQPVSAKHLAARSGYRSYSTFSLAFKQRMGLSVTVWMDNEKEDRN